MTTAQNDQFAAPGPGAATVHRPVDAARVAALRARIEAGDYAVDPAAIADRLVAAGFPGPALPNGKDQNDSKLAGDTVV